MIEKIIFTTMVYLLIGYSRLLEKTEKKSKEKILYFSLFLFSSYLSYLFITDSPGFNIEDLLTIPFEKPANKIYQFFTSP
ncbi:hypothetical protein [Bacillus sp. 2205SS5-2]|uniref:hypothetical protein n=1 Tax=Bacillus sp. 2205SS5-2 TaxID=3109031 RepID=UPI003005DE76